MQPDGHKLFQAIAWKMEQDKLEYSIINVMHYIENMYFDQMQNLVKEYETRNEGIK